MQNRRCVLFLGPNAYPYDEDLTIEEAMWKESIEDSAIVRYFYQDDGLVLFQKKSQRGRFLNKIKGFFDDKSKDWSLTRLQLNKIIQLPFLAIVNLTIDDLLPRYYQEMGFECHSLHYIFRPSLTEKPISDLPIEEGKPLVLNLLGSIRSSDNLILTHSDLFDFLRSLFDDKDQWLQILLHEADCFLFIGVDFKKWYLQLLIQKLSQYQKSPEEAERYAISESLNIPITELYQHELKIQLVEDGYQQVIDQMYRFSEENNILNKPKYQFVEYKHPKSLEINRLLLRGELNGAIKMLLDHFDKNLNADLYNELIILSSMYHSWQKDQDELNKEENNLLRNRIVKRTLHYIKIIDELNAIGYEL